MRHLLKCGVWDFDGGRSVTVLYIAREGKNPVLPLISWLTKSLTVLFGTMIAAHLTLDI
jgi:hypothetical protein